MGKGGYPNRNGLGSRQPKPKIRQKKEMIRVPTPKNKRKFALWLYPETLEKIGQLYTADDCRSKSEFK